MVNTPSTIKNAGGILTKYAAQIISDSVNAYKSIVKIPESEFDSKNGYKAGDTLYVNVPWQPVSTSDNMDVSSNKQDFVEQQIPMKLDITETIALQESSLEFKTDLDIKSYAKRVVEPAAKTLAQNFEARVIQKMVEATYNSVGTPGSTNFDTQAILDAKDKLQQYLTPLDMENRFLLMNSSAMSQATVQREALYNRVESISKQYEYGYIQSANSFNWFESELTGSVTVGNDVTGVAINGTIAEGASTLTIDGLTINTGTVTVGSVFTVAGVNAVHPVTKVDTGQLQQFVVTASVTADGSGAATISVSPSLYTSTSAGKQNVTALPADNAALTFKGSASTNYKQALAFYKNSFAAMTVPLIQPSDAIIASSSTVEGITVNLMQSSDVNTRKITTRFDVVGALAPVRPEHSCRIWY